MFSHRDEAFRARDAFEMVPRELIRESGVGEIPARHVHHGQLLRFKVAKDVLNNLSWERAKVSGYLRAVFIHARRSRRGRCCAPLNRDIHGRNLWLTAVCRELPLDCRALPCRAAGFACPAITFHFARRQRTSVRRPLPSRLPPRVRGLGRPLDAACNGRVIIHVATRRARLGRRRSSSPASCDHHGSIKTDCSDREATARDLTNGLNEMMRDEVRKAPGTTRAHRGTSTPDFGRGMSLEMSQNQRRH
mmetsp:Transcript_15821/g.45262  ORF Transcript_15821/g.45262 Transcript_15821/m.45262 type:complete len:248 (+) Transcript_15821:1785-2528(+)